MNHRHSTVLIAVLALTVTLQPASAQQSAGSAEASPYRVVLAVSSNMAQQKISEAAADGYRVVSILPTEALHPKSSQRNDNQAGPGSGLTIVLKRSGVKQSFDYRLLAIKDTKEFKTALNRLGADGFRLVPSSLQFAWAERKGFDTFLDPEAYSNQQKHGSVVRVALMEKTPNDTLKYSYQQVSGVKEIEKLAAHGYYPVSGSVLVRFVVLEAQATPSSTKLMTVQHARLAKFDAKAKTHPDITVETTAAAKPQAAHTANSDDAESELDVKLDEGSLAGKKLLMVNDGAGMFAFTPVIDVLTASGAPDAPPFYRLLLRNEMASTEKAINDAGAQGLRLFPRIGTAFRVRNQLKATRVLGILPNLDVQTTIELHRMMAVMYPGASGCIYRYRLISPASPAELLRALNAAEADGFQFLSLWRGMLIVESERHAGDSR